MLQKPLNIRSKSGAIGPILFAVLLDRCDRTE
jgi:hypothetical protein